MDELEAIRRRKMQEYMALQEAQAQMEQARQSQAIGIEIKKLISTILTTEAMQRLSNIRASKPELAQQIEVYLIELYRAKHIKIPLGDEEFRKMLDRLIQKPQTKIVRKSK